MAKVFRIQNSGNNVIEDWQNSEVFGKTMIQDIKDPNGATDHKEITSIPSPFARIDLVKSAFENVVISNQLEGTTIFHKMVSDSLDVGELFFNIDKLSDKLNIITWDKTKDLNALINSNNARHKLLGQTLKMYFEQDAKSYNFDKIERLYLLNYKKGKNELNIIGGTSPATLFFTSANKLDIDIKFSNDTVFDASYQPLYKRDFSYQKFLFGMKKFMPEFSDYFGGVADYLDMNFKELAEDKRAILNNYKKEDFDNEFEKLMIGGDGFVEVLGKPLFKKVQNPDIIEQNSDFVIASTKYTKAHKPLILPIDDFAEQIIYVSGTWNQNTRISKTDSRPLHERTLPEDNSRYPYHTISDFLEPYIIRTVFPIDDKKYFTGNFSIDSGKISKGYLLPLKKDFFDYFDVEDIQGQISGGRKMFEMKESGSGGVNVTLRIPIKNGKHVTYERTYYPSMQDYKIAEPDIENNRGAITENQFTVTIAPFFKLEDGNDNFYRVALMERDLLAKNKNNSYSLEFYKNIENQRVNEEAVRKRSDKSIDFITSQHFVLEKSFEYCVVKHSLASGIVIPLFNKLPQGVSDFKFAIDFGTTNTHVEYRKDGGTPQPLEILREDVQIGSLFDIQNEETITSLNAVTAIDLYNFTLQEFIPEELHSNTEFSFPQRTVINSKKSLDLNQNNYALADLNIPFTYEKQVIHRNSIIRTNLKWSNFNDISEVKLVEAYFENLLFLIRNKILLNGGDLKKTKLIWLYPSSMSTFQIGQLEAKWSTLFRKYINSTNAPEKVSESIAPFYYYSTILGVQALANPVISVDIGGETTDVVLYINNKAELLTSFRFAANAVFGSSTPLNGFIQKYLEKVTNLLKINPKYDLLKVLEDIKSSGKPEDLIAFFFSLEKNTKIRNSHISFSELLKLDKDFRVVFLLFYSSLVYHIAKMMKAKNLDAPRYIIFSGNGSKIIELADSNEKFKGLTKITEIIFKDIFSNNAVVKTELKRNSNPKEISCKGALLISDDKLVDVVNLKTVLLGTKDPILIPEIKKSYSDINSQIENEVVEEYNNFIDWFFQLNKKIDFKENFDIGQADFNSYKEFLKENALDNLKICLQSKREELKENMESNIIETLFFYPLIGGIRQLSFKIHTELNNNEI